MLENFEDNETNKFIIGKVDHVRRQIKKLNIDTIVAESEESRISKIKKKSFDLV